MSNVLVTGGSGFVASHVIVQLLQAGHTVRTTVRSPGREATVRGLVQTGGADPGRLGFAVADLERDDGWQQAMAGCEYVMHVASPMPPRAPKHPDELIKPARDGVLRVLTAARDGGVKRVIFTSTCGTVYYGQPPRDRPFDERDYSDPAGDMSDYVRSKILAERAAWDFVEREGGQLELTTVNPAGIFGPALGSDYSASLAIIQRLLAGMPGCLRIYFGVVDVRDVAELHLRAMTHAAAPGERFIAVVDGPSLSMVQIARLLRARLGEPARRVPTRQLPDWLVRLMSRFRGELVPLVPMLGKVRNASSAKAQRLLGWRPRPAEEAVVASAESLLRLGLVGGAR